MLKNTIDCLGPRLLPDTRQHIILTLHISHNQLPLNVVGNEKGRGSGSRLLLE